MGKTWARSRGETRRALLALAFVALAFKVLVPPGFMVAQDPAGRFLSIVICTGHGPLTIPSPHGSKAPPVRPKSDTPCAFAGQSVSPPPADLTVGSAPIAVPAIVSDRPVPSVRPGRGLAAPPPPSQAPPVLPV